MTQEITPVAVEIDGLRAIQSAEIDAQIATAKRYPRDEAKCLERMRKAIESLDAVEADGLIYNLPARGGEGPISGGSIRLAEIIRSSWPNLRTSCRTVSVGATLLTAEAVWLDLESNIAHREEVTLPIVNKRGERYSEELIAKTGGNCQARALRNVVLKSLPRAFWAPLLDYAEKQADAQAGGVVHLRAMALKWCALRGISEARVCARLKISSTDQINEAQLKTLRAIKAAVMQGDVAMADEFPELDTAPAPVKSGAKRAEDEAQPPIVPVGEKHELSKRLAELRLQEPETVAEIGGLAATGVVSRMTKAELQAAVGAVEARLTELAQEADEPSDEEWQQAAQEAEARDEQIGGAE